MRDEDCWGATQNTARYQHLVNRPNCSGPDEWLPRFGDVYAHAAVIGANLDPISGDAPGEIPYAAAIFLHRHSYAAGGATKPTSGCVSLAMEASSTRCGCSTRGSTRTSRSARRRGCGRPPDRYFDTGDFSNADISTLRVVNTDRTYVRCPTTMHHCVTLELLFASVAQSQDLIAGLQLAAPVPG